MSAANPVRDRLQVRHGLHQRRHGILPWLALVTGTFLVVLASLALLVLFGLR